MTKMMMQRRDLAALLGAAALPGFVQAQGGAPVEGKQYLKLASPLPTATPGKVEVIEFFWFGCPACFAFDAPLEAWVKTLPADVSFRRVHVGFSAIHKLHQRMFLALEAMGLEAELHARVFVSIHRDHANVNDEAGIVALMGRLGVDAVKFKGVFNSFGVQTKALQGTKLSDNYRITSIPTLAIGGQFTTMPSSAGGPQGALQVADHLIRLARNSR